jgi:uncharacterized protein (DUF2141 family)
MVAEILAKIVVDAVNLRALHSWLTVSTKEIFMRFALLLALPWFAAGAEVEVAVRGFVAGKGVIACALFRSAEGFPMDAAKAQGVRLPATGELVVCRFENVTPGRYALAVSHDANANGKTDTNILGMPTEAWAVSNNARPKLRAPKFEEAAFPVGENGVKLEVKVVR